MPVRTAVLLALTILAAATPSAIAAIPPEDDPPGGNDSNKNHVYKLKPWKAKFEYRIVRDARTYDELNARSDVSANVVKRQWFRIDCQLTNTTQNGQVLWNHIPNVGWIADHNMKTYTDGRIPGSPSCAVPGPNHVWFGQSWAVGKEYRLKRNVVFRTRPAGAMNQFGYGLPKSSWTTIECAARANRKAWVRVVNAGGGTEGWINADALQFWQKGLPAGLPTCTGAAVPRHFVVLGDSYAAGIGAGNFDSDSGECYRSKSAYWALLAPRLAPGLTSPLSDFEACSGDTTSDLRAALRFVLDADTKLITVSIGGNDMHFADVVKGCVYPGGKSCQEKVAERITPSALDSLRGKLDTVYREIRGLAPNALVLVLGYPELVPRDHIDGCGAMDDGDAPALQRAATLVNGAIKDMVGKRPKFRFVGLVKTFLGHPACNKGTADWINGVSRIAGGNASFHPNALGNAAIAERIVAVAPRFFR